MNAHRHRHKKRATKGTSALRTPKRYRPYKMRVPQVLWLVPVALFIGFGGVLGFFAGEEMRSSKMQSEMFSETAQDIYFQIKAGGSPHFYTPAHGPYNRRLGYSYLPFFFKALDGENFTIAQQMRTSQRYIGLVEDGIYPVYHAKTVAGLRLQDQSAATLYQANFPVHTFPSFDHIPPLLIQTLLFVEDRDLLKQGSPTKNPVIEWDRFFYAAIGRALRAFVPGLNLGGGSTLATQIEKFRFSPGGQTNTAMDKIRQIISGSLRVYLDGKDTRNARKQIVLDYLNSTPLSARRGFGEINSIGDGFWAWFGRDLDEVSTALNLPETDIDSLRVKATVYREALGLILAQRRPTYYLLSDRAALDALTDKMLGLLLNKGIISGALYEAARHASFHFLPEAPPPAQKDFLGQKAVNALRTHLLQMLGVKDLYELDRIDLTATTTLNKNAQMDVSDFLRKMSEPEQLKANGLYGFRLLTEENDPAKIKWSFLLYEKTKHGNLLRVQADNIDGPLDMNEGVKLDLGSTAKLRTLITYLEIIAELYNRHAGLSRDDLRALTLEAPDVLSSWATMWLSDHPEATLDSMIEAAMDRQYSASPHETFFTGGGAHTFVNFDKNEDSRIMDLHEALRDSVNLVFIRLMRDVVNYTISQGQQTKQEILSDPEHPARKAYLERYAEREGATFLNRYLTLYKDLPADDIMKKLASRAHKGATARIILFRSLYPLGDYDQYLSFMNAYAPSGFDQSRLSKLFNDYPTERYNLSDRGYITGINPLELWLASYIIANPKATHSDIMAVSKPIRLESYAWLFHKGKKGAQDTRIRILLELDAFARIQLRWARLGYPFDKLVPSYATAIGSSADRPSALAELVGILLNDGLRKPMLRFEELHFAQKTPYETILRPDEQKAERVLPTAITRVVRAAMSEVVENGTARRLKGSYLDSQGAPLLIGGKTGTGDHRYDEYGPGHKLISSRVINRTGTLAFYIGPNFFGTLTAHVSGEDAGKYKFTSALAAQTLKALAPALNPLITHTPATQKKTQQITPTSPNLPTNEGTQTPPHEVAPIETAPRLDQQEKMAVPAPQEKTRPPSSQIKKKTPKIKKPDYSSQELMMDILPN